MSNRSRAEGATVAAHSHRLTRDERRVRNREALLRAAEKLFAERGIDGASLDEVAAEAGLTKGAVYSNFANKEDLILAVLSWRGSGQEAADAAAMFNSGRTSEQLVDDYTALWAAAAHDEERKAHTRLGLAFLLHANGRPEVRDRMLDLLLGDGLDCGPELMAPEGSELARLPGEHIRTILQALNVGLGMLTQLDPTRCPPELYGVAVRLLAGLGLDPRRPYPPVADPAASARQPSRDTD